MHWFYSGKKERPSSEEDMRMGFVQKQVTNMLNYSQTRVLTYCYWNTYLEESPPEKEQNNGPYPSKWSVLFEQKIPIYTNSCFPIFPTIFP